MQMRCKVSKGARARRCLLLARRQACDKDWAPAQAASLPVSELTAVLKRCHARISVRLLAAACPALHRPAHLGNLSMVEAISERICTMRCARLAGSMVWVVAVEASSTVVAFWRSRPSRNCGPDERRGGEGGGAGAGAERGRGGNDAARRSERWRRTCESAGGVLCPAPAPCVGEARPPPPHLVAPRGRVLAAVVCQPLSFEYIQLLQGGQRPGGRAVWSLHARGVMCTTPGVPPSISMMQTAGLPGRLQPTPVAQPQPAHRPGTGGAQARCRTWSCSSRRCVALAVSTLSTRAAVSWSNWLFSQSSSLCSS